MARDTTLLEWYSDDYIGTNGDLIPISSGGPARIQTRGSTVATRVDTYNDIGITVIVSELYITASEQLSPSSVICGINSVGPRQVIDFITTSMYTFNCI